MILSILSVIAGCVNDSSLTRTASEFNPSEPDIELLAEQVDEDPSTCAVTTQFTIKNAGRAPLDVSSFSMMVSYPAETTILDSPTLPDTLIADDSVFLTTHTIGADGIDDVISLLVSSNDPDEPTASISRMIVNVLGPEVVEAHEIEENQQVDILLVVDNSCSMSAEQASLAQGAFDAIDALEQAVVDYRIGVITTDSPSFVGPQITSSMADPYTELQNQVNVGIRGFSIEKGIQMSITATSPGGDAAPSGAFLRDDAKLGIVWVSDEDDWSAGTLNDWAFHFWNLKVAPSLVVGWAIVNPDDDTCIYTDYGVNYIDLATTLGGGYSAICLQEWGNAFGSMGSALSPDPIIYLDDRPVPNTIRVFVGGNEVIGSWVYVTRDNAIAFNPGHVPIAGSIVEVIYNKTIECN